MLRKRKDYIVTIITSHSKQDIQVKAENKKEAENMVDNVLLGCEYFVFKDKSEYQLKIRRKKWRGK